MADEIELDPALVRTLAHQRAQLLGLQARHSTAVRRLQAIERERREAARAVESFATALEGAELVQRELAAAAVAGAGIRADPRLSIHLDIDRGVVTVAQVEQPAQLGNAAPATPSPPLQSSHDPARLGDRHRAIAGGGEQPEEEGLDHAGAGATGYAPAETGDAAATAAAGGAPGRRR